MVFSSTALPRKLAHQSRLGMNRVDAMLSGIDILRLVHHLASRERSAGICQFSVQARTEQWRRYAASKRRHRSQLKARSPSSRPPRSDSRLQEYLCSSLEVHSSIRDALGASYRPRWPVPTRGAGAQELASACSPRRLLASFRGDRRGLDWSNTGNRRSDCRCYIPGNFGSYRIDQDLHRTPVAV